MVNREEWFIMNKGEGAGGEGANEEGADQPRSVGDSDGVDVVPSEVGVF